MTVSAIHLYALRIENVPTYIKAIYIKLPDNSPQKPNENRAIDIKAKEGIIRFNCIFSSTKQLTLVRVDYLDKAFFDENKDKKKLWKTVNTEELIFTFNWIRGQKENAKLELTDWNVKPRKPIEVPMRAKLFNRPKPIQYGLVSQQKKQELKKLAENLSETSSVLFLKGTDLVFVLQGTQGEEVHIVLSVD